MCIANQPPVIQSPCLCIVQQQTLAASQRALQFQSVGCWSQQAADQFWSTLIQLSQQAHAVTASHLSICGGCRSWALQRAGGSLMGVLACAGIRHSIAGAWWTTRDAQPSENIILGSWALAMCRRWPSHVRPRRRWPWTSCRRPTGIPTCAGCAVRR